VGKYTSIIFSENKLYVNLTDPLFAGDRVYAVNDNVSLFSFISGVYNRSFDDAPDGFTISSANSVKIFSSNGSLYQNHFFIWMGFPKHFTGSD
jgi:hypothetical protein